MSDPRLSFERQILRALRPHVTAGDRLLLALSGGVDSMVMAEVMLRLRRLLKVQVAVAHVHHGASGTAEQKKYRNEARALARAWAKRNKLQFFTNVRATSATSEAALREFRNGRLEAWRGLEFSAVVFAHHLDDLLETRMIRLIRGTGAQGLRSMSEGSKDSPNLRPMLSLTRAQIVEYAHACGLRWGEDPSNLRLDPLRNGLRQDWLPQLEEKRAGALPALARSLENLLGNEASVPPLGECVALRRDLLSSVTLRQQRETVARYLRALGVRGYGHSHVDEILKRLRVRAKDSVEFEMLRFKFHISPDFLWASRV